MSPLQGQKRKQSFSDRQQIYESDVGDRQVAIQNSARIISYHVQIPLISSKIQNILELDQTAPTFLYEGNTSYNDPESSFSPLSSKQEGFSSSLPLLPSFKGTPLNNSIQMDSNRKPAILILNQRPIKGLTLRKKHSRNCHSMIKRYTASILCVGINFVNRSHMSLN